MTMKIDYEANRAWQQRTAKPLARTRMKRQSRRKRKENAEYATVSAEFLQRHRLCHHCIEKGIRPPKRAKEVHHTAGRHGGMLTDTRFFMAVASECHTIHPGSIHQNVAESHERGWMISRGASMALKLLELETKRGHFPWVKEELERG